MGFNLLAEEDQAEQTVGGRITKLLYGWMFKKSLWWRAAFCSAYISVLNYNPRLSGSHDWISWPRVTTHRRPLVHHTVVTRTLSIRQWEWTPPLHKRLRNLHSHTRTREAWKTAVVPVEPVWPEHYLLLPNTDSSLTSHVDFVRESWLLLKP